MTTANVQQRASITDPTDLSAVNNISAVITGGYGGPHAVFDKDHYKGQMRQTTRLIEFNAAQGQITGHPYCWVINLLAFNDDNITEMLPLPPATDLKDFMDQQMAILLEKYQPRLLYFPATNYEILAADFKGEYTPPPASTPPPET